MLVVFLFLKKHFGSGAIFHAFFWFTLIKKIDTT